MSIKKISKCCSATTYIGQMMEWEEERARTPDLPPKLFEKCEKCHERVFEYNDETKTEKEILMRSVLQAMLMNPGARFATATASAEETATLAHKYTVALLKTGLT